MDQQQPPLPDVAIDADGYWWRAFEGDHWSMCPSNPDNSAIPRPVRRFKLVEIPGDR